MCEGQRIKIDVPRFNVPVIIALAAVSWIPVLTVGLLVLP
jgi:hypothetical protein